MKFKNLSTTKKSHEGLMFKLKQNGVSGPLLRPLNDYLTNRRQRVVLNSYTADHSIADTRVPQESVFGPLLLLIYINDLQMNIKSQINFFADDTMLFSIINDSLISASGLNLDLANNT